MGSQTKYRSGKDPLVFHSQPNSTLSSRPLAEVFSDASELLISQGWPETSDIGLVVKARLDRKNEMVFETATNGSALSRRFKDLLNLDSNQLEPDEVLREFSDSQKLNRRHLWLAACELEQSELLDLSTKIAESNLSNRWWISHDDLESLQGVAQLGSFNLVYSPSQLKDNEIEKLASRLATFEVHAVKLALTYWSKGNVAMFRKFHVASFADGFRFDQDISKSIHYRLDGVLT